ncbi:VOC family protein [Geodermatophilus sp. YIM 151500]|uniref:VOC family protein n=1 Tax=Geodermatophilus sp. YIM 151500 TaxID=2984531 RepID=UPI0021E3696F|nr:VOC family protein [Geodermatophilus sp. YIM 151500]MCV2489086.1 VOC family protein [Geodermatophilus sp. YIM 151500]
MPATVRPIIVTPDIDRLRDFYTGLLSASMVFRYPEDGPLAYIGLQLGDSELGLSASADVVAGGPSRMLLSIEVPDVDALLPRVAELGGRAESGANDMPWGQRVAHVRDPDGNVVNLTQTL